MGLVSMTRIEPQFCLICGAVADSREHKFKRSDLLRSPRGFSPGQSVFLGKRGFQPLQGPNSKLLKFGKVLCQDCNTTRSQPYDRAYECLSTWLAEEGKNFLQLEEMDFKRVYGDKFEVEILNFLRYLVKHLACRIGDAGFDVPEALRNALTSTDLSPFSASFAVNVTWAGLPEAEAVLVNYPIIGIKYDDQFSDHFLSGFSVGYFAVVYRIGFPIYMPWEGEQISCAKRIVRLGRCDPAGRRSFRIGDRDFRMPVLTDGQRCHILDNRPREDMSDGERLAAWLTGVHQILLPGYPDLTKSYLEKNLTLPVCREIWDTAFSLEEAFL
jgi:hypothetical protein